MKTARNRNVPLGMVVGFMLAIVYSIIAVAIQLTTAGAAFEKHGATFLATVATYFVAGITGGAAVGYLLPWTRRRSGSILVGIIAGIPAAIGFNMAISGPFWHWKNIDLVSAVLFAVLVGGWAGYSLWSPP